MANQFLRSTGFRFTPNKGVEWSTLCLIIGCYLAWGTLTAYASVLGSGLTGVFLIFVIALHSSLQHEVLHGHPTKSRFLNELLVFPAIGLFIPYQRFRQTHLQHHIDPNLTDPYEDPESNYYDPDVWKHLSIPIKTVLQINNTLLGRILLGPAISLYKLYSEDLKAISKITRHIGLAYIYYICLA